MSKRLNLIGMRSGKLRVVGFAGVKKEHTCWNCICDCGNTKIITAYSLKTKSTKSCGCLQKEMLRKRNDLLSTHKMSYSSEYKAWAGIKKRCSNKKLTNYKNYGGRGIKICNRWKNSFKNFYEDMGKKPSNKHSIDRIDVNGNYEPENCRWATAREQQLNRRDNLYFEYNNEIKHINEIAEIIQIKRSTLLSRIRLGWTLDKVFNSY